MKTIRALNVFLPVMLVAVFSLQAVEPLESSNPSPTHPTVRSSDWSWTRRPVRSRPKKARSANSFNAMIRSWCSSTFGLSGVAHAGCWRRRSKQLKKDWVIVWRL